MRETLLFLLCVANRRATPAAKSFGPGDDNFYPVSLSDIQLAEQQNNQARVAMLKASRAERFEVMERLAELPRGMVFFTQITMEAGEDPEFLEAFCKARIMGALVGIEAVTAEGVKAVFKDFNLSGERLVERLRKFQEHGVHVLGSFIFGLPTDRPDTFQMTQVLAQRSGIAIRPPQPTCLLLSVTIRILSIFNPILAFEH